MDWRANELLAERRGAGRVQRAEPAQHLQRTLEGQLLGSLVPRKRREVVLAPTRKLERGGREVDAMHLGRRAGLERAVVHRTPQTKTQARLGTTSAPRTLLRGVARNAHALEPVDSDRRVEARNARQATVDHGGDALDRDRSLGDVGREHDAPLALDTEQRSVLGLGRKVAEELSHERTARGRTALQALLGSPDLSHAGQEHQHVARHLVERDAHRPVHVILERFARVRGEVTYVDRKETSLALDAYARLEKTRGLLHVQRRRHHDQSEIGTHLALHAPRHRERQVGREAAFVELVEHDAPEPFQERVGLQTPQQHALGHDAKARVPARLGIEAHAIPDLAAQTHAALGSDPAGRGARGQAPGLEHPDLTRSGIQDRRRHARRLARAGRRGERHVGTVFQGLQ